MNFALLILIILLLLVVIVMLTSLQRRSSGDTDLTPIILQLDTLEINQDTTERAVLEAIAQGKQATEQLAGAVRPEIQATLKEATETLVQSVDWISQTQQRRLEDFAAALNGLKRANEVSSTQLRTELRAALKTTHDSFVESIDRISRAQQQLLDSFAKEISAASAKESFEKDAAQLRTELATSLKEFRDSLQREMSELADLHREQPQTFARSVAEAREASETGATQLRTELSSSLADLRESLQRGMGELANAQKQQLDALAGAIGTSTEKGGKGLDEIRGAIDAKFAQLQSDHITKVEQMRATVDEKLQATMARHFGDSFTLLSAGLDQIHKALGEMQMIATGLEDLKRVLTDAKPQDTARAAPPGNVETQPAPEAVTPVPDMHTAETGLRYSSEENGA